MIKLHYHPNAKTPVLVDGDAVVFDSNAILLYLAEKTGQFLPDAHLADRHWMLGERYTLVDMAVWGWARAVPFILGADAWRQLPNVKRLLDEVNAHPAAQRTEARKARHAYRTEMDDAVKQATFPKNARLPTPGAA